MPLAAPPSLHGDLEQLDRSLVTLRRLWQHRRLQDELARRTGQQLSPTMLRTLRAVELAEREEPCVGDVADALAVDPSTASRFVDAAVRDGYLSRTPAATDRRRAVLGVTPRGARVLAEANTARVAFLAELTDDWSPDDVRTLAALLDRLRAATLAL